MCPGKKQPNADTGPWDRDLDTDLDAITDVEVTTMVTLMESHEIAACALSSETLTEACQSRGIAWHHCPIVDLETPSEDWEKTWDKLGESFRQMLQNGENILLHCRGGRGRAGMIAARLLVELGMSPDTAISNVRIQRPEAIETAVQEEYVSTTSVVADR